MNNTNTPAAVVVGHDHQNTLGVIRSLGEDGIRVNAVILSDGGLCATAYSKYIDRVFIVHPNEIIDTLLRIGSTLTGKAALIPCGDDTVAPIDKAHNLLMEMYHLPHTGSGGSIASLMNKMTMLQAAREAGLKVPDWVGAAAEDFPHLGRLCKQLTFPCILKPVDLLPGGIFEFRILETADELHNSMDYITKNCSSIIVQEFIRKTGEYGVNACRLHDSGETIFGGVIEKKRFSQASLGSTTAGTILPDQYGLYNEARRFVEHIDYRGIFDMEFITDGKDFYFVEMNFRNGGYGYACTKAGRNLPAIWVREACGIPVENCPLQPLRHIFFINESADLQNVRAGNVSIFTWLADVLRAKAHMYINCRDMQPLLKKIMRK